MRKVALYWTAASLATLFLLLPNAAPAQVYGPGKPITAEYSMQTYADQTYGPMGVRCPMWAGQGTTAWSGYRHAAPKSWRGGRNQARPYQGSRQRGSGSWTRGYCW